MHTKRSNLLAGLAALSLAACGPLTDSPPVATPVGYEPPPCSSTFTSAEGQMNQRRNFNLPNFGEVSPLPQVNDTRWRPVFAKEVGAETLCSGKNTDPMIHELTLSGTGTYWGKLLLVVVDPKSGAELSRTALADHLSDTMKVGASVDPSNTKQRRVLVLVEKTGYSGQTVQITIKSVGFSQFGENNPNKMDRMNISNVVGDLIKL